MTRSDAYKTVISAFFSSRGYFTMMDQKLYGTEYHADVVAVLPIFKELQWRTQIGYAPCGILQFLPADGWVEVDALVEKTGYDLAFVGRILEEAAEKGWIELDLTGEKPMCRNIKYHKSVRECIAAFATGAMDPVNDWDAYLASLDAAGLQDWLNVAQAYWDRSHAA